jgi:hypothetical protein
VNAPGEISGHSTRTLAFDAGNTLARRQISAVIFNAGADD